MGEGREVFISCRFDTLRSWWSSSRAPQPSDVEASKEFSKIIGEHSSAQSCWERNTALVLGGCANTAQNWT